MNKTEYLQGIVDSFNSDLHTWEDLTDMRANFGFRYDPDTGRKYMYIIDTAVIREDMPAEGTLSEVAKVFEGAGPQVIREATLSRSPSTVADSASATAIDV